MIVPIDQGFGFDWANRGFGYVWATFGIVWFAAVGFSKPQARTVPIASRLSQSAILILGFLFIFSPWLRHGWLGTHIWPTNLDEAYIGLAITCGGVLFAFWARFTLGTNWSSRPMVKVGHELIVKGPYRLVRHPIYTGLLLAGAGSAIAVGRWCIMPGMALVVLGLLLKISQEERLMTEAFPAAYPDYRRQVKALIPWAV
mgnify:CR=1 FL=1